MLHAGHIDVACAVASAQVISLVFEKALGDVFFQDMYAELCSKLSKKSGEWCQKFLLV